MMEAYSSSGWISPTERTRNRELLHLRQVLLQTTIPSDLRGDDYRKWCTNGVDKNDFSASQTWDCLRPMGEKKNWADAVWFKGHVPKMAFTFWVATMDRLPVRGRLSSWTDSYPLLLQ